MELAVDKSPGAVELGRTVHDGATVLDLAFPGLGGDQLSLLLVVPDGPGPFPTVLYLHWYAHHPSADRFQFLDEGLRLAANRIASAHLQGRFPWKVAPNGLAEDRRLVKDEIAELLRTVDLLQGRPEVDRLRLAVVGHDFGGMYGAVLAGIDRRVMGLVMMASVPAFADWFVPYWDVLHGTSEATYRRKMSDLDPVAFLGRLGSTPVLFQFAEADPFVSEEAAQQLVDAVSGPTTVKRYLATHALVDAVADEDRASWLADLLTSTPMSALPR